MARTQRTPNHTEPSRTDARAHVLEPQLTPEELSLLLKIPVETLYQWRRKRTGPPAARVGRHLRYDPADVCEWLKTQTEAAA